MPARVISATGGGGGLRRRTQLIISSLSLFFFCGKSDDDDIAFKRDRGEMGISEEGEEGFGVEIHLEAQFDTKGISTKNLFILHSRPFKDSPKTS